MLFQCPAQRLQEKLWLFQNIAHVHEAYLSYFAKHEPIRTGAPTKARCIRVVITPYKEHVSWTEEKATMTEGVFRHNDMTGFAMSTTCDERHFAVQFEALQNAAMRCPGDYLIRIGPDLIPVPRDIAFATCRQ